MGFIYWRQEKYKISPFALFFLTTIEYICIIINRNDGKNDKNQSWLVIKGNGFYGSAFTRKHSYPQRERDRVLLFRPHFPTFYHTAPVTGWELAGEESVTESVRPWKLPAAGAMRQRWITTMSTSAAFSGDQPTTYSPPCVTSAGATTFKDHKSCKCHQSLTKAICPESPPLSVRSESSAARRQGPDSDCRHPSPWIHLPSRAGAVKRCVNYDPRPVISIRQ